MKKFFAFILILGVIGTLSLSVFASDFDIRKLKWGMSYEEIQQIEGIENEFYKEEELLATKVEVLFGCDNKGLYSVTYSAHEYEFAEKVGALLRKKYGEPKSDVDYSFLIKFKNTLSKYPDIVVNAYEKNDFKLLSTIKIGESNIDEKKVILGGLSKRDLWEYGNTVVLLLKSPEGVVLTYLCKTNYNDDKKKFTEFYQELKKNSGKVEKKPTEEGEKI